jgi:addiction module RelE/StbE family toxin
MKVRWTHTAVRHLSAIHDYIAQDSPIYARRMVDRLTRRSQQIVTFPYSGRKVPEYEADDIREIIEASYRLIYRIQDNHIDILAVIHGAQTLPPAL